MKISISLLLLAVVTLACGLQVPVNPPQPAKILIQKPTETENRGNYMTVTAERLYIREQPSMNSKVVGVLKQGERVQFYPPVIKSAGTWLRIDGGYIGEAFVRRLRPKG